MQYGYIASKYYPALRSFPSSLNILYLPCLVKMIKDTFRFQIISYAVKLLLQNWQ